MAGHLRAIVGPMFSGKCVAEGTGVLCSRMGNTDIVQVEHIRPGDFLIDENGLTVPVATISKNVSTLSDPLYHIDYVAGGDFGRTSIIATLDHLAVVGKVSVETSNHDSRFYRDTLVDTKVRNIIENAAKYGAIVSMPIIGRTYYGITLVNGYHFMIMPVHGSRPVPTHNSSLLVTKIETYQIAGHKCVIIKHSTDVRFGEACVIRTHSGHNHDLVPVYYAPKLLCPEIDKIFAEHDVIGIDEIQFFSMYDAHLGVATIKYIDDWVAKGKIVICAGLDSDWRREPFGVIAPLVAHADKVVKLSAVCMRCHAKAAFSARTLANSDEYLNPVGGA